MLRRLFHLRQWGPGVDEGVEWEIRHHMEERVDELMSEGRSREAATEEALRSFGDVQRVRRELRSLDRQRARKLELGGLLETLWQDVRYGARGMRRNPGFTLAIVLTLGLGVGANAALFGVIDALLLRPLPYERPEELREALVVSPGNPSGMPYLPWAIASELRQRGGYARAQFAHTRRNVLYTGGVEPLSLPLQSVTPGFHETLGVRPLLGRGLLDEDARPAAPHVVLLDHAFWTEQFGQDASVIGRVIEVDDIPHEVIGVMPPRFKFPEYSYTSFWVPLRSDGTTLDSKVSSVHLLTRVPESSVTRAGGEIASLGKALFEATGATSERSLTLGSMQASRARNADVRRALWLLSGAVLFILLVAGANTINLLLVRASVRTRELAIRFALGASRVRVFRQMMTETFIIALLSGVVAVLLALSALRALQAITPEAITFFAPYDITLERRTLLFTFALAGCSGFLFGLVPAIRAVRTDVPAADAGLTSYGTRTRSSRRLRRSLVVGEVALAVPLLTAAFLLCQSFVRLLEVDPGFEPQRLAVVDLNVSAARYRDAVARTAYVQQLEERLERVPGVVGVTVSMGLPPRSNFSFGLALQAEGAEPPASGQPELFPHANVRPDFFDVTGARLLHGRPFNDADAIGKPTNVIIDRDLARFLWADANAVGRRFRLGESSPWLTVVGVMADIKLLGPVMDAQTGGFSMLYPMPASDVGGQISFTVRAGADPARLLPDIRAAIYGVDATQPIGDIGTASTLYAEAVEMPRFLLVLMGVLGSLGLTLAALGIYAVLAFGVSQRRHELAVRMALGARARDVRRMVVGEGLALAALGALLGVAASVALTRIIRGALFDVEPYDPVTLALVVLTMLTVAVIASFRPAHSATTVDPLVVIRAS